MQNLSAMMQQALPEGGVWLPERKNHMEIMDQSTSDVWMSVEAVTDEQFLEFPLPANWRKVGHAAGAMDQAGFCHSPDSNRAAVKEKTINGVSFINVARPEPPAQSASGLIVIRVNKAHVLGFNKVREISVLYFGDQCFVEVVGNDRFDSGLPLASEARIEEIKLNEPWLVKLPDPTITLWAFSPSMRSFQGPIELPQHK